MRSACAPLGAVLLACASPPPPAAPSPPASLMVDCFLGADPCAIELDLDGDRRADTITPVRDAACAASDDERRCRQGFWLALAAGPTQLVGAGAELPADPAATDDDEPIPLEADLGFLHLLSVTRHRPDGGRNATQLLASPCAGDALVLSGSDAAFLLCWRAGSARAYHLGY